MTVDCNNNFDLPLISKLFNKKPLQLLTFLIHCGLDDALTGISNSKDAAVDTILSNVFVVDFGTKKPDIANTKHDLSMSQSEVRYGAINCILISI
jgi:hypothetical protein